MANCITHLNIKSAIIFKQFYIMILCLMSVKRCDTFFYTFQFARDSLQYCKFFHLWKNTFGTCSLFVCQLLLVYSWNKISTFKTRWVDLICSNTSSFHVLFWIISFCNNNFFNYKKETDSSFWSKSDTRVSKVLQYLLVCEIYIMWLKQFKLWKAFVVVAIIVVINMLTYKLLHYVWMIWKLQRWTCNIV